MARIERVEDIDAWKESRELASTVYRLTGSGPWAKDFGLRDQIRRAAVSVPCNIAEGFARDTEAEFIHFLAIARGSASEVKTQLYIALDLGYIEKAAFDVAYDQIDRICRIITGFMRYLRTRSPRKPSPANRQPSTDNQQPTTVNRQPTTKGTGP